MIDAVKAGADALLKDNGSLDDRADGSMGDPEWDMVVEVAESYTDRVLSAMFSAAGVTAHGSVWLTRALDGTYTVEGVT